MKFAQKIIIGILMVFTLGCTHNKKTKLVKPTPKPLVWHIAGLPNWFILSNSKIIYKRWGINIFLDGCSGSIEGIKSNKKIAKILEKRHGKYWRQVFEMAVDEEIVNRYSVIDLVSNCPEVVKIQKEFNVSIKNSNTRVICIGKNRYAVLVTWYDPNNENKQIPGQQLIVNLATKAVTKSNEKFDWSAEF
ncbi:hypothetical protein GENT5_14190 [Flavobacterium ammoniigenes]|uniref:Lipoprotein n=1 Tax=Flavobacterium ammoniigenes TaxID=1751095 RepID=A0ABN6L0T2_9FLAO|nr:hypothetical protein [Flavobacterium ammoniigenes]BDB55114.1 hypothetical protein GENT5_14190 [Flavobacterium ammoniigenes]